MDGSHATAPTSADDLPLPVVRPSLEPEPQSEHWLPRLTPGFAVGWTITLGVLGMITAVWLVGMVATTLLLVLGKGGWIPVAVFATTGVLLGRGWVGMVQTIRGRLRPHDLADAAALPASFASLSPGLQRLVRHTRSLQIVVRDPELPLAELDREMFEWLATMAALKDGDRQLLESCGLTPDRLREELVHSRYLEDRSKRRVVRMLRRGRWHRRATVDHRGRVRGMLDRLEREVLRLGSDPFRGAPPRASRN